MNPKPNATRLRDLFEYMRWRDICHHATPSEFERLFQDVMKRARPGFVPTKPHGNLGDRKTDGFDHKEGIAYQVYSPSSITPSNSRSKIREDLEGGLEFWGEKLRTWTFVYNGRGVVTDVVANIIRELDPPGRPELEIMTELDVWRILRDEVSDGARQEILGGISPNGWEEVLPLLELPNADLDHLTRAHLVVIHNTLRAADPDEVVGALHPTPSLGAPICLRPSIRDLGWQGAARAQAADIMGLRENAGDEFGRLAVFPLSEIPLLIHLGYTLTDTSPVKLFQYHRFAGTWRWPSTTESPDDEEFTIEGLPDEPVEGVGDVVLRVSLSARVHPAQTQRVTNGGIELDFRVNAPSREWLKREQQLHELRRRAHLLLDELANLVPGCERIHLFYAGPAPGAVAFGQAINPRMAPPVQLYEYHASGTPEYEPVLLLDHSLPLSR